MTSMRRAPWWLSERRRAYGALVLAALVIVPTMFVLRPLAPRGTGTPYFAVAFLTFAVYLVAYDLLTGVTFSRAADEQTLAWARETRKGSHVERYVLGSEPGIGVASGLSVLSLVAIVASKDRAVWAPIGLSDTVGAVVLVVLLVAAWAAVGFTYAVEYLSRDQRSGEMSLSFPGSGPRRWVDYLYFSFMASTTFGTTDVEVCTSAMRRTVMGHGVVAFVFNTVVLALAISGLS